MVIIIVTYDDELVIVGGHLIYLLDKERGRRGNLKKEKSK